ncbi:MAG: hypothetical protein JWM87_687 [Candidatus Eremiobacteraeota bacterium]|nr:hypothetical protein [Candidatus Eremiobacteraeota bacterium]
MTDKALNHAAAERGFKTNETRKLFRNGYADAQKGMDRPAAPAPPAYIAGFDLYAEHPTPQPGEHTIAGIVVMLNRAADDGFEVTIPIKGGTNVVYGDTPEIALDAARDRIKAATHAFEETDKVRNVFQRDVQAEGESWIVHVTERVSGAVEIIADAFDDVKCTAASEEAGLTEIAALIAAEQSETVDGERAKVVHGNGKATAAQLPMLTPAECAAEVHRCLAELAKREAAESTAKKARVAAETALAIANTALLDAVDRAAKPELFETAAAA